MSLRSSPRCDERRGRVDEAGVSRRVAAAGRACPQCADCGRHRQRVAQSVSGRRARRSAHAGNLAAALGRGRDDGARCAPWRSAAAAAGGCAVGLCGLRRGTRAAIHAAAGAAAERRTTARRERAGQRTRVQRWRRNTAAAAPICSQPIQAGWARSASQINPASHKMPAACIALRDAWSACIAARSSASSVLAHRPLELAIGGRAHAGLDDLRDLLHDLDRIRQLRAQSAQQPPADSCARASTRAAPAARSSTDRVPDTAAGPGPRC